MVFGQDPMYIFNLHPIRRHLRRKKSALTTERAWLEKKTSTVQVQHPAILKPRGKDVHNLVHDRIYLLYHQLGWLNKSYHIDYFPQSHYPVKQQALHDRHVRHWHFSVTRT